MRGDPADWQAAARTWRDAGASHISVVAMNTGLDPAGHLAMLEPYITAVRS
jgi:hypothetical protein